ncbi:Conserved oligomeric Golgi complex subunit [Phytophthora palmivora]|uniref:Conserved oligomeric Golgi complex subunit 3 n=1 Tax=Phytophthora palmivora TaxID=4796 RepID=A0A2P4Y8Z7_9STRA|nr:Conserved oligomeric Golgi complex subunit [Phytophthora palmivora]
MTLSASPRGVRETPLTASQDALLHALERQVELKAQAETHASLLRSQRRPEAPETLREFVTQRQSHVNLVSSRNNKATVQLDTSFMHLSTQMDTCMAQWDALYSHAHASQALVAEMEASHVQVAAKTQALYRSFEDVLQQVEALDARVAAIAAPMPHFTAIDGVAHALGFGVKFAAPSSGSGSSGHVLMERAGGRARSSSLTMDSSKAVQVFQHRRGIDPTTQSFEQALEKIDASVAYLTQHLEYKDSACFIEAYKTLAAGGIQCLKDYALSGLDAAKDAVYEAIQKEAMAAQQSGVATSVVGHLDETSAYYVNFQLVAPALAAVAKQLERLNAQLPQDSAENLRVLGEVADAYATQRVQLLSPVLGAWLDAVSQTSDIVNVLRASCAQLLKVCEAEFRLFLKLFGHDPSDELFTFSGVDMSLGEDGQGEDDNENAFERLIFQLSGLLYNTVRPQFLAQKDLEVLCEVIQVLRSEVIEAAITPRASLVGYAEPVMHRMIQDAQERLILCMQKYIRDEIEGFVPTPADLDYPAKLVAAEQAGASLYATWYPSLEHTLMCLSKGYHFVKMEIFEELAQDAIQICTVSLKMASADIAATQGGLHGSLFLVKHLLTLREQITPFEIQFAQTSKALDFTSSADAMNELLVDASTLFRFSGPNGIVGLFTRGIPQIQETTADVKKELEQELKKSCTAFIEIVLQQLAQPLLALMKQIAHVQQTQKATALDFRQCAFTAPAEVNSVLVSVSHQLREMLPEIQQTIRLYLRNASTETILFKPVQRNLLDAVENLNSLMQQTYTHEELQPCEEVVATVLQQLCAL